MKNEKKCYFCHGGPVERKKINNIVEIQERIVEIEGVPCDICKECGEKYFEPETIKHLQETLKHKIKSYIKLPVYSYV